MLGTEEFKSRIPNKDRLPPSPAVSTTHDIWVCGGKIISPHSHIQRRAKSWGRRSYKGRKMMSKTLDFQKKRFSYSSQQFPRLLTCGSPEEKITSLHCHIQSQAKSWGRRSYKVRKTTKTVDLNKNCLPPSPAVSTTHDMWEYRGFLYS